MNSDSKQKTYVIQMFFNPTPFGWENHFCQQSWCFKSGGVICAAKTGPVVCMPGCVFFFCGKDLGKWHLIHILRLVSQLAQWSLHTRSWTVLVNDPFWRNDLFCSSMFHFWSLRAYRALRLISILPRDFKASDRCESASHFERWM